MLPVLLALALSAAATPAKIVVDAGSSGTRVYRIEPRGCAAPAIELLGQGRPLADSDARTLPDLLGRIVAPRPDLAGLPVTVIGTGGFRRLDGGRCASACALKRDEIAREASAAFPRFDMRVVTGEEEGELSRRSVAALTGDPAAVVVELGGATAQAAWPGGSVSALIGVAEVAKAVPACRPPSTYAACRAGVEAFASERAAALLAAPTGGARVVGVGGAFGAAAAMLSLGDGSLSERLDDLKALAARACAGEPLFRADTCAMLSAQTLLVERLGVGRVFRASVEIGAALEGGSCPR